MSFRTAAPALAAVALLGSALLPGRAQTPSNADDAIARIRDEGLNHSHVMETLSYLTDVIGPRLTASPAMKRANEWTRDTLSTWGLQNAHIEPWGVFGRGWTLKRFSAQVVEPQDIPLLAYPKAWSPGYRGTADVVYLDATDEAGLEKYKGALKGAIVLPAPPPVLKAHFEAQGTRLSDADLEKMENATPREPGSARARRRPQQGGGFAAQMRFAARRTQFLVDEGVAATLEPSRAGDDGTIFVQSATVANAPDVPFNKRVNPWSVPPPKVVPQIVVASEQYNRLVRMIKQGEKLKVNVDLAVQFTDKPQTAYNTVAEIPGSDLKDQLVMLGGHMDSWHAGTGATDNGAGVAVCMEAVRILESLHLQPRRTVRIALWSGEEEGLFGSRGYVAEHLGSRAGGSPFGGGGGAQPGPLTKKPEYDKVSVYFNLDNGTGKVRGIYAQGNEAVRPIFHEWLAPFKDLGATTVTIDPTGSTDHVSFDAVGVPGFQFIQDEIEYESRTHHSNMDVYDRAQEDDLKQASVLMAAFVYDAAMRDEMMPRKPLTTVN